MVGGDSPGAVHGVAMQSDQVLVDSVDGSEAVAESDGEYQLSLPTPACSETGLRSSGQRKHRRGLTT